MLWCELRGLLQRNQHLHLQSGHPPFRHEMGLIGDVGQCGGIALAHHTESTGRHGFRGAEGPVRQVTGGAADVAIKRQPVFIEKPAAERPADIGESVVLRKEEWIKSFGELKKVGRVGGGRLLGRVIRIATEGAQAPQHPQSVYPFPFHRTKDATRNGGRMLQPPGH